MVRVPTLKTLLSVEKVLREANEPLRKWQIKERLPTKIPHATLNLILDYLTLSKKIVQTQNGISWVFEGGLQEKKIVEELEERLEK
jgi:hypothetical protein